ncbi:WW domain-binding protein 4-like isoform X1 [Conger conger]|nr:WW domain-binding protein 4-like isoform X1 [Conger conger]
MEKEVLGVEGLERLLSETGSGETQSGKTDTEAPFTSENMSEVWVQGVTDDGQTYYYNTQTGEAQWEKPEEFEVERKTSQQTEAENEKSSTGPWVEVSSPDGTYYYNSETEETSWEKPAELSPPEEKEDTPSPNPEALSGEEESLTGAEEDSRVLQEEDNSCDSDDTNDANDDDDDTNDDKITPPEDEEEEETPAKKARKTSPCATGEQAEEEQDPNEPGDQEESEVKIKESTIVPTVEKRATQEVSRKRKLENGKSRSFQQRGKDDNE